MSVTLFQTSPNLNEFRRLYPLTVEHLAALSNRESWLNRVWEIEQRWQNFQENPDKTDEVIFFDSTPKDVEIAGEFEIVYAGGTLGLLHAAVMAKKYNRKVMVFDAHTVGKTHRDWNISDAELQEFVKVELFTKEEIETALPPDLDALPRLDEFRLRGLQMTRLETFIDAAFAFAITMLVIAAQQIPDDIAALLAAFRNVPTFIFSIFVIGIFWRGHWLWSRRYGLEDGVSIFVSWAMLVTILIYIYPLKAVFGAMFYFLSHGQFGRILGPSTEAQVRTLFAVYAIGFTAIAFEILLLNLRAWQLRVPLRLDARERLLTRGQLNG